MWPFDLEIWPTDLNINRDHLIKDSLPTKYEASGEKCSRVFRCISRGGPIWPFDLDIWPTDLNISRNHLLVKDSTNRPTCAKQYCRRGIINVMHNKAQIFRTPIRTVLNHMHLIYTHRQKLSNTTFFRRHCFGSCRTEYVGNENQIFWILLQISLLLWALRAKNDLVNQVFG